MIIVAASSTTGNALSGGAGIAMFGLVLVLMARSDPGQYTRPMFKRWYAKRLGPEQSEDLVDRIGRFDVSFYRVLGWVMVAVGCVGMIVGAFSLLVDVA